MDPNYQYGYQQHQTYQTLPAPNYNSYNAGYAQPPAYNPGWSMPSGHAPGYCGQLPPPQPITVINYQPPQPVYAPPPLPVAYDIPSQNHYNYRQATMAPVGSTIRQPIGYSQTQPRPLVPASYQTIPQPSGFSGALGRVGLLGKHEKKRIRKMQKENDKMAMKQRKAMTYMY